jgi:uncharacterized protein YdaU (DUF1376 family)
MGKDPAVLFYTQDFITGTLLMTDEQRGKYILLLCLQHQKGSLSEQDMLKICGKYDAVIWTKFIKEGEYYFNIRMKEEARKRRMYCQGRRNNRKGKHIKSELSENHMSEHMENENGNDSEILKCNGFKKPSIEEIQTYCSERENNVIPNNFFDFYESKGWMIGKNKMKDWRAALRNWEHKNRVHSPLPRKARLSDHIWPV